MELYLVQGCGVSLICEKGETMKGWLEYIVERGGMPRIQPLSQDALRAA